MKFNEAKLLFDSGALSGSILRRSQSDSGWVLEFKTHSPISIDLILQTSKGDTRVFRSIEAAIVVLDKIGFPEITLVLSV